MGVAWKAVFKRNDISRAADETAPRRHIGNVTELRFRNVQKAGKLLPVCGGLVEQNQELRVCQHQAGGIGAQQLLHVLRQPCDETVVFADTLPQLVEEVGAVWVAEQKYR